ncbi:MAG: acyl-CoA dehydrogenase family protein, partial [Alphaproteobacteria bacterium]
MNFALTEEQRLLKESADRFVEKEYTFDARKKILASEPGFSRKVWAQFAELGWLGMAFPESAGGFGGSAVEVAVLM